MAYFGDTVSALQLPRCVLVSRLGWCAGVSIGPKSINLMANNTELCGSGGMGTNYVYFLPLQGCG